MSDDYRNTEPKKDLGAQGTEDTLKGKATELGGTVQKKAGQLTGNQSLANEGRVDEAKGNIQSGAGKVERKADDVLDDVDIP